MLETIKLAWQTNKLKFFLVVIPVVLLLVSAIFLKVWRGWLVSSAKKLLENAKSKDEELKKQEEEAKAKAAQAQVNAIALGKKADEARDGEGDPDWHKK